MTRQTITIPATIEEAVAELDGIEALLTAKGWERAAIVAAFVRIDERPGGDRRSTIAKSRNDRLSTVEFAALGIAGLRTADTVRLYVQRWLDANGGKHPKPGARVTLPTTTWPPSGHSPNVGIASEAGAANAIERIIEEHGPQVVAAAARRPEVADAIVDDHEAHSSIIRASGRATPAPTPRPIEHTEPFARLLARVHVDTAAMWSTRMREAIIAEFGGDYAWRPGEREAVLERLTEIERAVADVRAVLTSEASDEALASLLGDQ